MCLLDRNSLGIVFEVNLETECTVGVSRGTSLGSTLEE